MTYILLIFIWTNKGVTTEHVPFTSLAACERAAAEVKFLLEDRWLTDLKLTCVKG